MSSNFTQDDTHLLARLTKSYFAQQELYQLDSPEVTANLAHNSNLDPLLWNTIYNNDGCPELRPHLLSNATLPDQAARFLSEPDPQTQYIALALGMPKLDATLLAGFIHSSYFDISHAAALLSSGSAPLAHLTFIWDKVRLSTLASTSLEAMVGIYNALTNEQAVAAIEAVANDLPELARSVATPTIAKRSISNTTVARVIDFKPGMIPLLMALPNPARYYKPIAISRHITQEVADQIYFAIYHHPLYGVDGSTLPDLFIKTLANLILNPATSASKRLEVSNYLAIRCAKMPASDSTARYLATAVAGFVSSRKRQLPELGTSWGGYIDHNPESYGDISADVAEAVMYMEPHNYPSLSKKLQRLGYLGHPGDITDQDSPELTSHEVSEKIDPYLDPYGPGAWRVFLHLLPEWQGELSDLLTTATGSAAL